ncbi:MAG: hypothetical protein JXR76_02725 [Deltaproteobacteria bacterium]|nr:hypothetical protein [Deltaproteobacteria bacterium]
MAVQVTAKVDIASVRQLSAEAIYTITNTDDTPISDVSFMLYPNRFREMSRDLPVYARSWIYPSGFSSGHMKIQKVLLMDSGQTLKLRMLPGQIGKTTVDGLVAQVVLPKALAPGQSVGLKIAWSVEVPKRRGRFGYFGGVLSLAGGWMPRPVPKKATFNRRPFPIALNLSATIPEGLGGYVLNRIVVESQTPQQVTAAASHLSEATLVLMDKMEHRQVQRPAGDIHYITNHYVGSPQKAPVDPTHPISAKLKRALTAEAKRIRRTIQVIDDMRTLFPVAKSSSKPLFVVEIPAWDRLSQVSDNVLLLSDRTFEVVPYPKALMFHQSDVAKTVATLLAQPVAQKENTLAPFVAEIVGYHFQQRYIKAAEEKREELAQLLRFLSFNPYVDNLIYAPQMPFDHAYIRSIEETDVFRGELWRTMNSLPRGKRIVAKLLDLLGEAQTEAFFNDWLQSPQSFIALLDTRIENGERFQKQWFGKYPIVGYALGKHKTKKTATGYDHEVEVIQTGEPIVEPVTVLVTDWRDHQKRLHWNGEGTRAVLHWHSSAPLKSTKIDPDYRLVETAKVQGHPLSDNSRPLGMRPPLLTDLLIFGDSVTRDPFVLVSFSFKRKYDISNSFHVGAAYTPRQVGGDFSYFRHYGYNRTLNSRTWYTGPRLGIFKYRDASLTESSIHEDNRYTATMASISILAGMDDRQFHLDPQSGKAFQISLGYWVGKGEGNGAVQHAKGSMRLFKVFPLSLGHTLVAYGGIAAVAGQPPASNLVTLSHQQILRGFDLGETYGRIGVYGVTEYRHTLLGSTTLSFPMRTLLSRVQGVLFTGLGSASRPKNYDSLFAKERRFMEVGYGLRFHFLLLGAVPYLIALDFVMPVFPRDRSYVNEDDNGVERVYQREKWRITWGVTQTF